MKYSDIEKSTERAMTALEKRMQQAYNNALKTSLNRQRAFFKGFRELQKERQKLIADGMETAKVDKYISVKVLELQRQHNVTASIGEELRRANLNVAGDIEGTMAELYEINGNGTRAVFQEATGVKFSMMSRDQISIIMKDEQPVFSKIAYRNLGQNTAVVQKLQGEMMQSAILGEGQEKLLKRIQGVTGQQLWQARRVAQTERTRVQSQARSDAATAAVEAGIRIYDEWRCKFDNSRDAHMELHGVCVYHGETFPDSNMRFPGDPNGEAAEVINCHCVLITDVLDDGQEIIDGKVVKKEKVLQYIADDKDDILQDSSQNGIINNGEYDTLTKEDIIKRFTLDDGTCIIDDGFMNLKIDVQREVLRGYDKSRELYPNVPSIRKIEGSSLGSKVLGEYSETYKVIRIANNRRDMVSSAFGTFVHESTHQAIDFLQINPDSVVKEAAKNIGLRMNSRKTVDMKYSIARMYSDDANEVVAYAVEKAASGKGNALANEILNIMSKRGGNND